MLAERLIVVIVLIPLGIGVIALGGPLYALVATAILGVAAWEYWRMFHLQGYAPSSVLVIGGVLVLVVGRALLGFYLIDLFLALLVLAAMAFHLVAFERGQDQAATSFGITIGGILYLGWIGAYLISLRDQPGGEWWLLLVLPSVWLADSGAYFIGRRWGRHKLASRLSPKKTWEGYLGGVLFGIAGGALLAALWGLAAPQITIWKGAALGLILAAITPLGDLGESLFKRQAGLKDSSNIIPGHGGIFDRIDSWLWGAVIGYYVVNYWLH
jgi:phosphatidate cytidylyltransferase